jgi:Eco57I restriction-modification methylase
MSNARLNRDRYRKMLENGYFKNIFNELGWDNLDIRPLEIEVAGIRFTFTPIAEKRGFQVFSVSPDADGAIPNRAIKLKLEREIGKIAFEHLLIYQDAAQTVQEWQWALREAGQPIRLREPERFHKNSSGERLIQRLEDLQFSFAEEDDLTIQETSSRVKRTFNVEKAHKSFFTKFEKEHGDFFKTIKGLPENLKSWYTSLMLNRLMFVYFVQKKSFLDGDTNYLRDRLGKVQALYGTGRFHSFYRDFLLELFHKGLGSQERPTDPEMKKLLGKIPYLNGGLFEEHQIEINHPDLSIPDEAFEAILSFFERFDWHLDNRPNRNDREINPDMLGYIFEKYINQKQMGAYYTKEDITEYISKNTILPHILETTREGCQVAFQGQSSVWNQIQQNPDKYIYPAIKRGARVPESDLPDFVQQGMHDPNARMFNKSYNLGDAQLFDADGKPATLPTETWREYIERRNRYHDLHSRLERGEVQNPENLITLNLDIRQFAQDVLDNAETADLVRAYWKAIKNISVLDPTCGSGAFLFAALNILQPLYQSALEKMREFVQEADELEQPKKYPDFRETLAEIDLHPNEKYFVLKSIIVNNLYGVDIMEEAVEIAKLRLFLKLMSEVEKPEQIEPLPDVDFNIRAGNTLVGYATEAELHNAMNAGLELGDTAEKKKKIHDSLEDIAARLKIFQEQQTTHGGEITPANKKVLRDELASLNEELNRYLADQYTPELSKKSMEYQDWKVSHKPFHWFVDFHRIMKKGGFDAIIGNPPYVEISKIRSEYRIIGYSTEVTGNLYAPILEKVLKMLIKDGFMGMIVPMSLSCTERMVEIRSLINSSSSLNWFSHYSGDAHPSVLFEGVKLRLEIVISKRGKVFNKAFSSAYIKWFNDARAQVFPLVSYHEVSKKSQHLGLIPKHGNSIGDLVIEKLLEKTWLNCHFGHSGKIIYTHRVVTMFIKAFDFIPYFFNDQDGIKKSDDYKLYSFESEETAINSLSILNSSIFFYYFIVFGDAFHCGKEFISSFPVDLKNIGPQNSQLLSDLSRALMDDLQKNSVRKSANSQRTGRVEYDEFWPRHSKPIIDQIDQVLAQHYGFTDEELDFIINYDIKYRMGRDAANDTDEA